ncbi:Tropomyosin domain containing protein [Pyrenophora tritici-repentis]|uniref:Neuromodulin multi-domain protein n=2 Tax=Pyrenophora tritici-repentis TaxID=45151 RepID=A0A2W1G0Z2_9PLEO|nr:uncharacterized protein PTRG_00096 [Pyrenophora tritici-repentis Pt-1C-BFP]KAA8624666.1 hypothetical protein PtrV1_00346 [Pyrenophora tritici-repentis]EDU39534.1 conserved hypothetical protein [Pyrenophora tritici-repentis Pt-1C-BFP]KAF7453064.1 hypothetical protein A1F99_003220 [Pyrenophora tritici-repentis]KAF7576111.1 Neuromodulin multi-domain protein [Pyrenophora tritici-repentis]KAG9377483.1 hypothetical protein A1F94_011886 [Pyrenophora tritici-repentis]
MSSGVNFWAAGNNRVKSASSPTPAIVEAPQKLKSDTMSQQKKGLVLRSMKNGTANGDTNGPSTPASTPNGRKTDWADEEEDSEFLAQFTKDPRITTLETTIVLKDERVKELEATVVTKNLRVAELEAAVQDRDHRICNLEADSDDKEVRIGKLEEANHEQFLQVQEFLRDVAKKDERITVLEHELSQKAAIILDLESKSNSDSQASTNCKEVAIVEKAKTDNSIATKTPETESVQDHKEVEVERAISDTSVSDSFEIVEAYKPEETTKESPGGVTEKVASSIDTSSETSPAKANSPTHYVTKDTLKVVPPAPKPKTLTFPIDFSKYAKKPAAPPATAQPQSPPPMDSRNGHTTPWGRSAKQARVKTDAKPTFNPSADIRQMSLMERAKYANGPEVAVKLGGIEVMTIPKYLLMQCSVKALVYFEANPDATSWDFPAGYMDADAAKVCLTWMDEMTFQGRVYSINLSAMPNHDKKNLHICRAARVMGLNNTYVGHFTKQLCDRIRNHEVSYEFMDMVCELVYPENDPIFDCLANNLVNQVKVSAIKDMTSLEKLMAKHATLKGKMSHIEQMMAKRMRKAGGSREDSQYGGSKERRGGGGNRGGHGGSGAPSKALSLFSRSR